MTGKISIKSSGSYSYSKELYVKSNGVWTLAKKAFVKVAGLWQEVAVKNIGTILQYKMRKADTTDLSLSANLPYINAIAAKHHSAGSDYDLLIDSEFTYEANTTSGKWPIVSKMEAASSAATTLTNATTCKIDYSTSPTGSGFDIKPMHSAYYEPAYPMTPDFRNNARYTRFTHIRFPEIGANPQKTHPFVMQQMTKIDSANIGQWVGNGTSPTNVCTSFIDNGIDIDGGLPSSNPNYQITALSSGKDNSRTDYIVAYIRKSPTMSGSGGQSGVTSGTYDLMIHKFIPAVSGTMSYASSKVITMPFSGSCGFRTGILGGGSFTDTGHCPVKVFKVPGINWKVDIITAVFNWSSSLGMNEFNKPGIVLQKIRLNTTTMTVEGVQHLALSCKAQILPGQFNPPDAFVDYAMPTWLVRSIELNENTYTYVVVLTAQALLQQLSPTVNIVEIDGATFEVNSGRNINTKRFIESEPTAEAGIFHPNDLTYDGSSYFVSGHYVNYMPDSGSFVGSEYLEAGSVPAVMKFSANGNLDFQGFFSLADTSVYTTRTAAPWFNRLYDRPQSQKIICDNIKSNNITLTYFEYTAGSDGNSYSIGSSSKNPTTLCISTNGITAGGRPDIYDISDRAIVVSYDPTVTVASPITTTILSNPSITVEVFDSATYRVGYKVESLTTTASINGQTMQISTGVQ